MAKKPASAFRPRSAKQAEFIRLYTGNGPEAFNATRSAIAAGYSERSARSIGSELLQKPNVRAAIDMIIIEQNALLMRQVGEKPAFIRKAIRLATTDMRKRYRRNLKKT